MKLKDLFYDRYVSDAGDEISVPIWFPLRVRIGIFWDRLRYTAGMIVMGKLISTSLGAPCSNCGKLVYMISRR